MCPSSWKLYVDDFPFFSSSLACLEPELELFEVWAVWSWCHWRSWQTKNYLWMHIMNADHLAYSDQSNHTDNLDWSMINPKDNRRIRIVYLVLFPLWTDEKPQWLHLWALISVCSNEFLDLKHRKMPNHIDCTCSIFLKNVFSCLQIFCRNASKSIFFLVFIA